MSLTSPQAGVDLGTVVKRHEDAVRTAKKGGSKKGGSARQRQAALEQAASGVQIRPKRRMPVSKVRAQHVRIVTPQATCLCFQPVLSLPSFKHALQPARILLAYRCCWWAAQRACPPSAALCAT